LSANFQSERISLTATDGARLGATLYPGPAAQANTPVLIAGALGVGQRYYAAFASWLAAQGHEVMSFDLRGMGDSAMPLRGLQADMLSWARVDFAAAVLFLSARHGGQAIHVIGHSLGAHHAVMTGASTQARISKLVSVAAGSGYWRDWVPASRRKAPLMFHLAGPLLTPLLGYFPGKRLGMVADLPAPVMRQWSRWCRHPEFAWGAEPELLLPSLHNARFPIEAFSVSDDEVISPQCITQLLAATPNAATHVQPMRPEQFGLQRIGHLGAFRREAQALWPVLAAALKGGSR
jgi:predicted alpha/beta hydrolase